MVLGERPHVGYGLCSTLGLSILLLVGLFGRWGGGGGAELGLGGSLGGVRCVQRGFVLLFCVGLRHGWLCLGELLHVLLEDEDLWS